jgi:acyl-CoA dehydrogenase
LKIAAGNGAVRAPAAPRLGDNAPRALRALERKPRRDGSKMDFSLNDDQRAVRAAIEKVCAGFDDEFWLARDRDGRFPAEFHQALARDGWLGICMPQEYGGAGLGITEAAIMMRAIAESGGAQSAASSVHMNIFGLNPVVVFATPEQKQRMLPPLIRGDQQACFAVTEPDAGLNTSHIKTKAVRAGDHYVLSGAKVWTSTAQVAHKMLILVRTTPRDAVRKPTLGLTLFYTDLDRSRVEVREIEKMGRRCVDSNQLFIDQLPVPVEDRIGEEGRGFEYILHGMNPERILIGAESVGIGFAALRRAARYAQERVVFDRPIGANQAIQHPLARNWMELQAANLMVLNAATLYDAGRPCGAEANAAKFLGSEAGFRACEQAVLTHGGYGYAKEYHVERYFREVMIGRIAPVTSQLIMSYVAEKVLGLPRSY